MRTAICLTQSLCKPSSGLMSLRPWSNYTERWVEVGNNSGSCWNRVDSIEAIWRESKRCTELEMKEFIRNPMNWLLVLIPVAVVVEKLGHPPAPLVFALSALAIVPLAGLLVQATEQISYRTGPAIGGLLNATFGNAPELILALVALRAGEIDLVKASLVGAILGNLLFALGLSFLVGGIRHHTQEYNARGVRIQSSMLMLAAISMILPSIFHNFITPETLQLEQQLNRNIALALLIVYALNLLF